VALFVTRHPLFRLRDIQLRADLDQPSRQEVLSFIEPRVVGKNFFLFSPQKLSREILAHFPSFGKAQVTRRWVSLLVDLYPRRPLAQVNFSHSGQVLGQSVMVRESFLVDTEGKFFALAEGERLDLVVIEAGAKSLPTLGELTKDGQMLTAVTLAQELAQENQRPSKITLGVLGEVTVELGDGLTVVFGQDASLSSQVQALRLVQRKYKMENKRLVKVDLRYPNPVVSFEF